MQKPHRLVLDRMSGYADEAAAYVRRRRLTRKPFARVYTEGGGGRRTRPRPRRGEASSLPRRA